MLASNNAHKVEELTAGLPDNLRLLPVGKFSREIPDETGSTFIENAIIKARHACEASNLKAIADDSGLVVPALSGEPGIRSARYAGEDPTDSQNLHLLLERMADITDRRATFVCILVFLRHAEDPLPIVCEGLWHGAINHSPQGDNGFGYDPVFIPQGLTKTTAELSAAQKLKISHRGLALARLQAALIAEHPEIA